MDGLAVKDLIIGRRVRAGDDGARGTAHLVWATRDERFRPGDLPPCWIPNFHKMHDEVALNLAPPTDLSSGSDSARRAPLAAWRRRTLCCADALAACALFAARGGAAALLRAAHAPAAVPDRRGRRACARGGRPRARGLQQPAVRRAERARRARVADRDLRVSCLSACGSRSRSPAPARGASVKGYALGYAHAMMLARLVVNSTKRYVDTGGRTFTAGADFADDAPYDCDHSARGDEVKVVPVGATRRCRCARGLHQISWVLLGRARLAEFARGAGCRPCAKAAARAAVPARKRCAAACSATSRSRVPLPCVPRVVDRRLASTTTTTIRRMSSATKVIGGRSRRSSTSDTSSIFAPRAAYRGVTAAERCCLPVSFGDRELSGRAPRAFCGAWLDELVDMDGGGSSTSTARAWRRTRSHDHAPPADGDSRRRRCGHRPAPLSDPPHRDALLSGDVAKKGARAEAFVVFFHGPPRLLEGRARGREARCLAWRRTALAEPLDSRTSRMSGPFSLSSLTGAAVKAAPSQGSRRSRVSRLRLLSTGLEPARVVRVAGYARRVRDHRRAARSSRGDHGAPLAPHAAVEDDLDVGAASASRTSTTSTSIC